MLNVFRIAVIWGAVIWEGGESLSLMILNAFQLLYHLGDMLEKILVSFSNLLK